MKKNEKKKNAQSLKRIIANNVYMLRFVAKFIPLYPVLLIVNSVVQGVVYQFTSVTCIKWIFDVIETPERFPEAAKIIALMAVLTTATALWGQWFWQIYNPKVMTKLNMRMHKLLFEKAGEMDLASYDDPEFFNNFIWAMGESDSRANAIMRSIGQVISSLAAIATILSVLLTVDISIVGIIVAFAVFTAWVNQKRNKIHVKQREELVPEERRSNYIERVFAMPEFAKEVRMSELEDLLIDRYHTSVNTRCDITTKYNQKLYGLQALETLLRNGGCNFGIHLILVFKLMVTKTIALGDFAATSNAVWSLFWRINNLVQTFTQFPQHSLYVEKFRTFMEHVPKLKSGDADVEEIREVELKDVSFRYTEDGKDCLSRVNLRLKKGEKVAIVGYNGAGKSTLVKLLMHLYDPTDGAILVNGRDLREYDLQAYRDKISAVFQDFQIFSATVAENVLADEYDPSQYGRVMNALECTGFTERLEEMEKGIDTVLTREYAGDGVNLSGGEAQKVAISRAFAWDKELVIMDEPSSALDPVAEYELNQTILSKMQDRTVIFISHRLSTTRMADRILMFDDGALIEEGSHDELMETGGKYAEMFNLQAEKYKAK